MSGASPAPPAPEGLLTVTGQPIPLLGVHYAVTLHGLSVTATVSQRFRNAEPQPVEALLLFPLPEEAAIHGLTVRLGDRTLRGEIAEREEAFQQYDEALAGGHGAFLLDQERPNLFQLSVGSLLPGQEATVETRLTWTARPEGRGVRLLLPTSLSPRYTPAHATAEERAEIDRITPEYASRVPYGLTLELQAEFASPLRSVESPSHPLRVELAGQGARLSFSQGEVALDRDVVVRFELAEPYQPGLLAGSYQGRDYLLLQLFPELTPVGSKRAPRDVTFVVDCSGSMRGDSIDQARRAVELCLRSLDEGDRFQILAFGSTFRTLFPTSLVFGQQTLEQAVSAVRRLDADLGGTEILAPLQQLTRQAREGRHDVLVLTDGEVSNEAEVLALAGRGRGRCRFFSFGIGAGASEHLVRGLARNSGGEAEFIYPGERIEPKVLRQFARLDTPRIETAEVDWGIRGAEQSPTHLPPVFDRDALLVTARLPRGEQLPAGHIVTLVTKTPTGEQRFTAPVQRLADAEPLALLWARLRLRELEEAPEALGRRGSNQRRSKAPTEPPAVALAKEFQLMCQQTSFLAVEERDAAAQHPDAPVLRKVPLLPTAGWHGHGSVLAARLAAFAPPPSVAMSLCAPQPCPPPCCAPPSPRAPAPQLRKSRAAGTGTAAPGGLFGRVRSFFAEAGPDRLGEMDLAAPAPGWAASQEAPTASPPPGADTPWYLELLLLARADGSFPLADLLARQAGVPLAALQRRAGTMLAIAGADPAAVLATALALALLRSEAAAAEPVWQLAAAKAEAWLQRQGVPAPAGGEPVAWVLASLPSWRQDP